MNYKKLGKIVESDNEINVYFNNRKLKRYLNINSGVIDSSIFDINKKFNLYINGLSYKYKVCFKELVDNIKLYILASDFEDKVVIENSNAVIGDSYFHNQLNIYNSNANITGTTIYNGMYATDNVLNLYKNNRFRDGIVFLKNNELVMENNDIVVKYLELLFNNVISIMNNEVFGYTYILSKELFNLSDFGSCSFNGINIDTLYMNGLNVDLYKKRRELLNVLYELKYKLLELNNKEKEDICELVNNNKLSKVLEK